LLSLKEQSCARLQRALKMGLRLKRKPGDTIAEPR